MKNALLRPNHKSQISNLKFSLPAFLLLIAPSLLAQEAQYFEEPPPKPKLSLQWDFLARYDRLDHRLYYPALDRGRFELRPEVDFDPTDLVRIGVRGVFDYGTEQYEELAYDNYRSRGAALERYYVLARPGRFAVRAGTFGMPLVSSEMLWDHDIQTPGAAVAWEHPSGALTLAAGGFYGPQRARDRSRIAAGQAVWRTGDESRLQWEVAASYWSFDLRHLDTLLLRENTIRVADVLHRPAADFHLGDLLVRARFPLAAIPILVSVDGIRNFAAANKRKSAYEVAVVAGRVGTPGNWRAFYSYQYIQRDAVVGAYNSDDWWFHTWYEGHRAGVAYTVAPQVFVQLTGMLQRRLDGDWWLNRYTFDLIKMF